MLKIDWKSKNNTFHHIWLMLSDICWRCIKRSGLGWREDQLCVWVQKVWIASSFDALLVFISDGSKNEAPVEQETADRIQRRPTHSHRVRFRPRFSLSCSSLFSFHFRSGPAACARCQNIPAFVKRAPGLCWKRRSISPGPVLFAVAAAAAATDEKAEDDDSNHDSDCNDEGFKIDWITRKEKQRRSLFFHHVLLWPLIKSLGISFELRSQTVRQWRPLLAVPFQCVDATTRMSHHFRFQRNATYAWNGWFRQWLCVRSAITVAAR